MFCSDSVGNGCKVAFVKTDMCRDGRMRPCACAISDAPTAASAACERCGGRCLPKEGLPPPSRRGLVLKPIVTISGVVEDADEGWRETGDHLTWSVWAAPLAAVGKDGDSWCSHEQTWDNEVAKSMLRPHAQRDKELESSMWTSLCWPAWLHQSWSRSGKWKLVRAEVVLDTICPSLHWSKV